MIALVGVQLMSRPATCGADRGARLAAPVAHTSGPDSRPGSGVWWITVAMFELVIRFGGAWSS